MTERIPKVPETVEEFMMSQTFGLEMTQEQIDAQKLEPKPTQEEVFFGPIARKWHAEHPASETSEDDDRLLLGS